MSDSRYLLTLESENPKVGPIPVSTSPRETCPDTCGLKWGGGCYADNWPLNLHWDQISRGDKGLTWEDFLDAVARMKRNQLWRHNQAGDLPGENETIDTAKLKQLVEASKGKRGFTFTHKPMTKKNAAAVKHAIANGFIINLSADTLDEADKLAALGIAPVTVLLHSSSPRDVWTPQGRRVTVCPAQHREYMTCAACQLCNKADRASIVGFLAHGTRYKAVDRVIEIKSVGNVTRLKEAA